MKRIKEILVGSSMCGLLALALPVPAAEITSPDLQLEEAAIQVLDILLISTNRVAIGTNTMSLAAAAAVLESRRDSVGLAAVHYADSSRNTPGTSTSMVARLLQAGVPLVVVEQDGEYAWRKHSGEDGMRTVNLGSEQLAMLQRLWRQEGQKNKAGSGPVVQVSADWDSTSGEYDVHRLEVGLFGERVWLIQEDRESDLEPGTTGLKFKKAW